MDYSIRPIGSSPARSVGPRRERGEQPPFELADDGQPARPEPEPEPAPADRALGPPDEDEAGAHLDLSA